MFTDDTMMTIAVVEAFMDASGDEKIIRGYFSPCGNGDIGIPTPVMVFGSVIGRAATIPQPYHSWGNGSAMRVSCVVWRYDDLNTVRRMTRLSAEVTHNHPEGIKGAEATASTIFPARTDSSKTDIKAYVEVQLGYDLSRTCDEIRLNYRHVESCQQTVPKAITAFLERIF